MAPQVPHTSTGLLEPEHSTPSCRKKKKKKGQHVSDFKHQTA
jgi:hypothetical protein